MQLPIAEGVRSSVGRPTDVGVSRPTVRALGRARNPVGVLERGVLLADVGAVEYCVEYSEL